MILDFTNLIELYAEKQSFSWDLFKELWIENLFTRFHESILNKEKKRSETNSYCIYLLQSYYEILKLFPFEQIIFKNVARIYILYSLYKTQKGFEVSDEEEGGESNYPIVSIPIDLNCFNHLIFLTHELFTILPQTNDILTCINELRTTHAFILSSHTFSYEAISTKKDQSSLLSSEKMRELLHLDSFHILEEEYNHLYKPDSTETSYTSIANQILSILPSIPEKPAIPKEVVLQPKERKTTKKRIQYQKTIEKYNSNKHAKRKSYLVYSNK